MPQCGHIRTGTNRWRCLSRQPTTPATSLTASPRNIKPLAVSPSPVTRPGMTAPAASVPCLSIDWLNVSVIRCGTPANGLKIWLSLTAMLNCSFCFPGASVWATAGQAGIPEADLPGGSCSDSLANLAGLAFYSCRRWSPAVPGSVATPAMGAGTSSQLFGFYIVEPLTRHGSNLTVCLRTLPLRSGKCPDEIARLPSQAVKVLLYSAGGCYEENCSNAARYAVCASFQHERRAG